MNSREKVGILSVSRLWWKCFKFFSFQVWCWLKFCNTWDEFRWDMPAPPFIISLWGFYHEGILDLSEILSLFIKMIMRFLLLRPFVVDYICWLTHVEPSLNPWNEANLTLLRTSAGSLHVTKHWFGRESLHCRKRSFVWLINYTWSCYLHVLTITGRLCVTRISVFT